LVRLHAEKYNIYKLNESSKFFRDHRIRHQIAQLIEFGSGLIESFTKYQEQQPTKLLKTKSKRLNKFVNGFIDIVNAAMPFLDATERVLELQAFNDLKNKGFYVDYRDKLMLPQTDVTEVVYNKTLLITERIFMFSKGLRILFHEKLENHMSKKELDEAKESLRGLIDNTMKDFSFKQLNKKMG
jgi:AbiV family abortive infection protein